MAIEIPEGGRRRVLIESGSPEVDAGRYPAKRIVGDLVVAECDLVADGHDALGGRVLFRRVGDSGWRAVPLEPVVNDRWRGAFTVDGVGRWELTFEAWIDAYTTWRRGTEKKRTAA